MGGLDEFAMLQRHGLAAHDARHVQPLHRADRDEDQEDVPAEEHGQQDDEEHEGQGIEDIDDAHHHIVDRAADIAGDRAIDHADHQADDRGQDADHQRDARAVQRAGEQVAAVGIRAEVIAVGPVGRRADILPRDIVHGMGRDIGRQDGKRADDDQHDQAAHGGAVAHQPAAGAGPKAGALGRHSDADGVERGDGHGTPLSSDEPAWDRGRRRGRRRAG